MHIAEQEKSDVFVVQLAALGAIGIARCFSFNGHRGNEMYNPEIKPKLQKSAISSWSSFLNNSI